MFAWIGRVFSAGARDVSTFALNLMHVAIRGLYGFLHTIFGDVGDAWSVLFKAANTLATRLDAFGNEVVNTFFHIIKVWIPGYTKWIGKHVYSPLISAIRWIGKEGAEVYHYISHPTSLAALLGYPIVAWLESNAWNVAEKLGEFFAHLFMRNVKRFMILMEDIIHAAL
jgi:hypothetical protein